MYDCRLVRLPKGIAVHACNVESVRMGEIVGHGNAVIIEMMGGKTEARVFNLFPDSNTSLEQLYNTVIDLLNEDTDDGDDDDNDDDDILPFHPRNRITPSNN